MKTSLDYSPPAAQPVLAPPAKTNHIMHERFKAQSQEANITLTTKEGDVISISQSFSAEHMRAMSKGEQGLTKISASTENTSMSFSVQGDLNDQELADLTSLLDDLRGIAGQFFAGNLGQAVNDAMDIGDMGSINQLEATFTRTSVLASYMEVPHPIPSFADQPNDLWQLDLADLRDSNKTPSIVDAMVAQWRQFLESFHKNEELATAQPTVATPPTPLLTSQQMLDRAKETMSSHPRLTPLIPSVADLAIDRAMQQFGANHNLSERSAHELSSSFTSKLNNWLL